MSLIRQISGGPLVFAKDWVKLCDSIEQAAEGFAATDAANAWVYRREAHDFACLSPPQTSEELTIREAEAATLRRRWSERLRQSQGP